MRRRHRGAVRSTERRREGLLALLLSGLTGAAILVGVISHRSAAHTPPALPRRLPRGATLLTISRRSYGRPVQPGFVGVSLEYTALEAYAGRDPLAVNPVLVRLIRNLAPGQAPVLRIGGDSTDRTWAPTRMLRRPEGIRFTLTGNWVAVTRALAHAADARLILGINLEANRRALATSEARLLTEGIGRRYIAALELGNEPELYRSFSWSHTATGRRVPGRPRGYDFLAFAREFVQFGRALPPLPLAGPAIGGWRWVHYTDRFVRTVRDLQMVTLHRYPLQQCYLPAASNLYPTIPRLLSNAASRGLATGIAKYVASAHARGLPLRVDELNTVSCAGAHRVSDTFAAALWGLNTLFELARVGVDGVNVHTFPRATYELFGFSRTGGRWRARVAPEYYGLLLFAHAALPGSRLLVLTGRRGPDMRAWATRAPDQRVRVVLINDSATRAQTVALRAYSGMRGPAKLIRLRAPALTASQDITLAGQHFSAQTSTGRLAGRTRTATVKRSLGGYVLSLPPASAAMLTLPRARK